MEEVRLFIVSIFIAVLGCSCISPHENFKYNMEAQIGKRADDPITFVARYPESVIGKVDLINGNVEVEYYFRKNCHCFFEIEEETYIILRWRFEGGEENCRMVP